MKNTKADYLKNPWSPAKQTILKDQRWAESIDGFGYRAERVLDNHVISELKNLFDDEHDLQTEGGGMFYSVYSQDIGYRQRIHDRIGKILQPVLDNLFKDYRVIINLFVIKTSGPKSEFYVHQDTTGLDEHRYSPLNLWVPLQNVDKANGCLGIVPYSHRFFTPYRSISFPAPFDHIGSTVRKYLQPVHLKVGEALIFDNRLIHHSYPNHSGETRLAVVCGLFPKEAELITCFKPSYDLGGTVELIQHDDRFLIENPNFLIDCQKRPKTGTSIGFRDDPYHEISAGDFEALCSRFGLVPDPDSDLNPQTECQLISEPVHTNIK